MSAADIETALGLVRFRLPARSGRPVRAALKVAVALVLLAGSYTTGVLTAARYARPGSGAMATASGVFGLESPRLELAPASRPPAFRSGSSLGVPGVARSIRAFRIQAWEIYTTGARKLAAESTLAAEPRSGLRLWLRGDDPGLPVRNRIRVRADLTFHAFDDRVYIGGSISAMFPFEAVAPTATEPPRMRWEESNQNPHQLVRPGAPVWLYFNGIPRPGQRNVALAIEPILGADPPLKTAARSAVFRTGFGMVSVDPVPVVQGAHLRIEAGDGTRWTTVFDRPRTAFTGIGQVVEVPGAPAGNRLIVAVSAMSPTSPLCVSYGWEGRIGGGMRCFDAELKPTPVTLELHGFAGYRLRVTLLDRF